jgi:hypothetical protein
MLHRSLAFSRLVEGNAPVVHYEININAYDKRYYLADCIYPHRATLLKTIPKPAIEKKRLLRGLKESCGEDINLACSSLGELMFVTLLEHETLSPCGR